MPKTLSKLGLTAINGADPAILGLYGQSQDVKAGGLFAAMQGVKVHGAKFARDAAQRGAVAMLTDAAGAAEIQAHLPDMALCISPNPRKALAQAAARFYGTHPKTMVAITGTNGKTSIASFCRQIWMQMNQNAINIGTIGVEGAWSAPLSHTTPDPITLHKVLAQAAHAGITHAALEASSHGLHQSRLDGITYAAAAFSTFSQDHLDYHATLQAYFEAKMILFEHLLPAGAAAVINADDPRAADVRAICEKRGHKISTLGRGAGVDLRLLGQSYDIKGQTLRFEYAGNVHQTHFPLIGGFQAENVMLAALLVIATGAPPQKVFEALKSIKPVRGRMQYAAQRENGAAIYVDYAHTPAAVETALRALRAHTLGRLVAVIGAGGDRDAHKRPLMGQAAAQYADTVFVTDDNPRFEEPAHIRAMVLKGAPQAIEVPDRATAILQAVSTLQAGDVLLIMGKGHETGQQIGADILPFDDAEQASISAKVLDTNGRA